MKWTLDLGELPAMNLNKLGHWAQRYQAAQTIREVAFYTAKQHRVPTLDYPTVWLEAAPPRRGKRDRGNLMLVQKHAIDGLVDAGVLVDDDTEHVNEQMVQILAVNPGKWQFYLQIRSNQ